MDIKQLTEKAMEIRRLYSDLEHKRIGRSWTNAEIAQGFAGDVGELMKVVMAKEGLRNGEDIDESLKHELADCLWSVLVLAEQYEIDLEVAFIDMLGKLNERIESELND